MNVWLDEQLLLQHEQRAGHTGEEAGDREREHERVRAPDRVGLGRALVVADADEHAPGAARAQAAHRDHSARREHDQRQST